MNLYFFHTGNRIKIGVSKNVRRRMGDVSRTSGLSLTLLGSIPGSFALERFVHDKLSDHRLEGEWFTDSLEVRRLVRVLLEDGPDAIGFVAPEPKAKISIPQRERTPEEWVKMDHGLLELLWPGNGYQEFAAFAEVPVEQVARWFRGEEKWPRAYRAAFASLVVQYACGNEHPGSWISEKVEAA